MTNFKNILLTIASILIFAVLGCEESSQHSDDDDADSNGLYAWRIDVDVETDSSFLLDVENDGEFEEWSNSTSFSLIYINETTLCLHGWNGEMWATPGSEDQPDLGDFVDEDGDDIDDAGQNVSPCLWDGIHDKMYRIDSFMIFIED